MQLVLEEEAKRYVSPTQLFDIGRIRANLITFGDALGGVGSLLFAVKSFPNPHVLRLAAEVGVGFEVSSLSEYDLLPEDLEGLTVSLNPAGPCDPRPFTTRRNRLHVNLNWVTTGKLPSPGDGCELSLRLCHTDLELDEWNLEEERPSRFGVTEKIFVKNGDLFRSGVMRGVHLHNGSEVNTTGFYISAIRRVLSLAHQHDIPVQFINLGGGFHPIPDRDLFTLLTQLDLEAAGVRLFAEPGHVLCRNAGYLICKAIDVRSIDGSRYHVILDTSYECHCKWSIPLWHPHSGLVAQRYPHNQVPTPEPGFDFVMFAGSSCYERDLMGVYRISTSRKFPIEVDDIVIFKNLNGYSYAWNTSFNGIPEARLRLVETAG